MTTSVSSDLFWILTNQTSSVYSTKYSSNSRMKDLLRFYGEFSHLDRTSKKRKEVLDDDECI